MAELEILEATSTETPNKDSKVFINDNGAFKQAEVDKLLEASDTIPAIKNSLSDIEKGTTANMLKPTLTTTTQNGITCTQNLGADGKPDGTYTFNGTVTGTFTKFILFSGTIYCPKLVGCPQGADGGNNFLLECKKSSSSYPNDTGNGVVVNSSVTEISIIIMGGKTVNNLVFKPMITQDLSASYEDYTPYTGDNGRLNADVSDIKNTLFDNAAAHNAIPRGAYLGTSLTTEQKARIADGSFKGLYPGDYWIINGITWRISHFDYWLGTGDTACNTHHAVIVPDTCLYNAKMNDSNITTGAYVGSKMYTESLANAKTIINNAFGSENILTHRELLANATSGNKATGWGWYDSTVELMNETMVFGSSVGEKPVDDSINFNVGIDKSQLALFALAPEYITNRAHWWLRGVVSSACFACVNSNGIATYSHASDSLGVRPAFAIKG